MEDRWWFESTRLSHPSLEERRMPSEALAKEGTPLPLTQRSYSLSELRMTGP